MTDNADNAAPTAAPGQELLIPKQRLDEVIAERNRLKEELAIKDQIYLQDRQTRMQPQQPDVEISPEETGLDPQMHQAVLKAAKAIATRVVSKERQVFDQQIGMLANRTEKAELLASRGSDKAKYLPEIQRRQQEHYRMTGGFLPAEVALSLIENEEKDDKIRQLEAKLAGKHVAPPAEPAAPTPAHGVPSAAGTRQMPTGGVGSPAPASKTFKDLTIDEMEAQLEKEFGAGNIL